MSPSAIDSVRSSVTGCPAASHDDAGIGQLIEDLQTARALSFDDPLMIERRHHRQTARGGFLLRADTAVGGRRAFENHFAAPASYAFDFDRGRGRRHDDHRRRTKARRGQRNRLSVISGRERDDATRARIGGEPHEHVRGAANLEGAAGLLLLTLEQQRSAGEVGHIENRRPAGDRSNTIRGLPNRVQ
jgi:hypothetical protein